MKIFNNRLPVVFAFLISVFVTANAVAQPLPPTLVSPGNGDTILTCWSIYLAWDTTPGAQTYRVQVSTSPEFSSVLIDESGLSQTTFEFENFYNYHHYYWRVNAEDGVDTSSWSESWSFYNYPPPPPTSELTSPEDGATGVSTTTVDLSWTLSYQPAPCTGPLVYQVQVSEDPNFNSIVFDETGFHYTLSAPVNGLSYNTEYFWRVRTKANYGGYVQWSDWSSVWSFTTEDANIIYDTNLKSPWRDASWSSTVVYTDTNAIHVSANAWGALSMHYGSWGTQGIDPSLYSELVISLYGDVSVCIYFENDTRQSFPYVTKNAGGNTWVDFILPMSTLNPNNYTINRIDIQSNNRIPVEYYVKNIRLIYNPGSAIAGSTIASNENLQPNENNKPHAFSLSQNYPNPFNPATNIRYELPDDAQVMIKVYNSIGQVVADFSMGEQSSGIHEVNFDGTNLASGVYFYRMTAFSVNNGVKFTDTKKMSLTK